MELDLDKIRAIRVLGRGATGTVFLVSDPSSPCPYYALKVLEKHSPSAKPESDRRARWELSILSRLSHPHLPVLLGSTETPELLAWALPFCAGGDLNALRYALPDRVFSTSAIRFYAAELVAAIAHLHSLGVAYRDLKPENVLLRADGHVTLTDFDLSRLLLSRCPSSTSSSSSSSYNSSPPQPTSVLPNTNGRSRRHHRRNLTRFLFGSSGNTTSNTEFQDQLKKAKSARVSPVSRRRVSFSSVGSGQKSFSFVGTEEYVSPEVVRGDGHEFAVDWWALGILLYEMAYGKTPFRGRNRKETFRNVVTKQPEFAGKHRSELTDLIEKLLAKDPTRRLGFVNGADEVRAHPFFGGVQWDLLDEVTRPPFLPPVDDADTDVEKTGFDVRDYFKKLYQPEKTTSPLHPSVSSFTEF